VLILKIIKGRFRVNEEKQGVSKSEAFVTRQFSALGQPPKSDCLSGLVSVWLLYRP